MPGTDRAGCTGRRITSPSWMLIHCRASLVNGALGGLGVRMSQKVDGAKRLATLANYARSADGTTWIYHLTANGRKAVKLVAS